jgi:imidazoleglycerol phosphate dehydratase HisB
LLYGDEPHHIVEALFKAFARAADAACQRDPRTRPAACPAPRENCEIS